MAHAKLNAPNCGNCGLKQSPFFCHLGLEELERISGLKSFSTYRKGQYVFYEGNRPQGVFCLHSGRVKVHRQGDDGKVQVVRFAKEGSLLGYKSLLSGDKYFASATAMEETIVCFIEKEVFLGLIKENQNLSMQTINMLGNDIKLAEHRMGLAHKPVRERIAATLLMLRDYYGLENDNVTIKNVVTRRDIGSIAGTTTETTIRVLSDFNHENIVNLMSKRIKLTNLQKLAEIAGQ